MTDMSVCRADQGRCPNADRCIEKCVRARVEEPGSMREVTGLDWKNSALGAGGGPTWKTTAGMDRYFDERNPKDIAGQSKPQLHLIPSGALIEVAKVMMCGAEKYGPYNWRQKKVSHTAYISAAERHERSHLDGEDYDPVASRPEIRHLASAAAGLLILIDAILTGNAIDDRPPAGVAGALINSDVKKCQDTGAMYRAVIADAPSRPEGCRCPAYCSMHSAVVWNHD